LKFYGNEIEQTRGGGLWLKIMSTLEREAYCNSLKNEIRELKEFSRINCKIARSNESTSQYFLLNLIQKA